MQHNNQTPPRLFLRFFRWYCKPNLVDHIEGDLLELYATRVRTSGRKTADLRFIMDVLLLFRPGIIRSRQGNLNLNNYGMFKSYFKTGWRTMLKSKGYSFINIGGLAMGMAVTMLISLWIWDEVSFDKNFSNYRRLAQVWQFVTFDVEKVPYNSLPIPLAEELRNHYPDFESVSLSSYTREAILSSGDKKFVRSGNYVEPAFPTMMSLTMLSGIRSQLSDMKSIMLSRTTAQAIFGNEDALNKTIILNGNTTLNVTGVYEDFPDNSSFKEASFLAPWDLLAAIDGYAKHAKDQWDENSFQIFVQLRESSDYEKTSKKIRDIRMKRENPPRYKPEFFLHPMSKWHLYSEFKNGTNAGGLITFVWLFGTIGFFVLILACINFMNLATARSEKRAKEVGLRKSIGSVRRQLVFQFLCESLLMVLFSFVVALVLVRTTLPFFNEIAKKQISVLWTNPWFWFFGIAFSLITGLLAGSYPALYLSSFQPIKVLKGTFRPGRLAALPRKALVVLQFTVSTTLMIGIVVVFRQIDFARNRPTGYDRGGLIEVRMNTSQLFGHYEALRDDVLKSGGADDMCESEGSITSDYGGTTAVSWQGKTPDTSPLFMANRITHEFGKTIGWRIIEGRDFSKDYATDSNAIILNESAAKLMALKKPTTENISYAGKDYKVIGVVQDMIKGSPFRPVQPSFFLLNYPSANMITIKLARQAGVRDALEKVESIFKKIQSRCSL